MVILISGALVGFQDAAKMSLKLEQPVFVGLNGIVIGVLFVVIAVMARVLQETWECKRIKIFSKKSQNEVALIQSSPELTTLDLDVDEKSQKSSHFHRGDTLGIELNLKSLKSMEIIEAHCTLILEKRIKTDRDRLKVVYQNAVEDITIRGRLVNQNQTVTYRFEQFVPVEQKVSSYNDLWALRMEIKAKKAADYIQDIPLKITT